MSRHGEKCKLFVFDVGYYIKERALDAKKERDAVPKGTPEYDFRCGRVIAYNEVISILQQTAEGFGIALEELQLDDIDPDRDLV